MIPKNRIWFDEEDADPWGVHDLAHHLTDVVREVFRAGDVFETADAESSEFHERRMAAYNDAFALVRYRISLSLTAKELREAELYVREKVNAMSVHHLELAQRASELSGPQRAAMIHCHQRLMYFRLVDAVMCKMQMQEYERDY